MSAGKIVAIVVASVVGFLVALGAVAALVGTRQEQAAKSSAARPYLVEPCRAYREISIRIHSGGNSQTANDAVAWFRDNVAAFDQAAQADGKVRSAATEMHWYNEVLADPARASTITPAQFDQHERPIVVTCTTGPGRA
jgi:hypothetical protein